MVHNHLSAARWSLDYLRYQWGEALGVGPYISQRPEAMAASQRQLAGGFRSKSLGQPLSIRQKPPRRAFEHWAAAAAARCVRITVLVVM